MIRCLGAIALMTLVAGSALGQTPQGAGTPQAPQTPSVREQAPAGPADAQEVPTAASLGLPVYPAAQYLTSYDAGGYGQRYYLFGTTAPFADIVTYYRLQLGSRGDLVFQEPPTHMFEVGRFREDSMVFPPGVTVKDWTWNSPGYLNPKRGGEPERFPTIIMIVPPPR